MYFKMERSILFFLVLAVPTIFSKNIATSPRGSPPLNTQNQSCTTSNKVSGICVSVFQCKKYFDIYKRVWGPQASDKDKKLLKSAHCGSRPLDQRVCCEKTNVSTIPENNTNWRCGKSMVNNTPKLIGAKNSSLGAWPWMAGLYLTDSSKNETYQRCGGSLIASDWVLTAAHCVFEPPFFIDHVRLGDLDINENVNDGAYPIEVKVKNVIKHPKYSMNTMYKLKNDIALLHLEEPVTFFDYISPICLHKSQEQATSESFYSKKRPTMAGWGVTLNDTKTHLMHEVSVDTTTLHPCKANYTKSTNGNGEGELYKSILCTSTPKKGACVGDSGGPLMFIGNCSVWSQGGIVSYGPQCHSEDDKNGKLSDVHTKVASFIGWIEKETGLKF